MAATRIDSNELLMRSLHGAALHKVLQPAEGVWEFDFETAGLTISCPWRLVSGGAVVLGSSDHGQRFGLPAPVDVRSETVRVLDGRKVEAIDINEQTGDLCIRFGSDARIDAFNNSGGYEGWNYASQSGVMVVAMGGGELAIWSNLPKRGFARGSDELNKRSHGN
ncbi:MAG: DUF6188 family protein [Candidatus Sulfotelmatobacter sp.]|jgi:hypothetical protein